MGLRVHRNRAAVALSPAGPAPITATSSMSLAFEQSLDDVALYSCGWRLTCLCRFSQGRPANLIFDLHEQVLVQSASNSGALPVSVIGFCACGSVSRAGAVALLASTPTCTLPRLTPRALGQLDSAQLAGVWTGCLLCHCCLSSWKPSRDDIAKRSFSAWLERHWHWHSCRLGCAFTSTGAGAPTLGFTASDPHRL